MNTVYLSLGSNQGQRETELKKALLLIEQTCGYVEEASSVYETAAWGLQDQPDFLNMAVCVKTGLGVEALLQGIQKIERDLHRTREVVWGPRTIDIDMLFFKDMVINTSDLVVPHPRLHERRFVLVPLNEIATGFVHPVSGKTIGQLLEECTDTLEVKLK